MDDEVLETLQKMKKQAEQISIRKVKVSENKQQKRHRKDKQIIECMTKLERLNTELALLQEEQEQIINALKKQIEGKTINSPIKTNK